MAEDMYQNLVCNIDKNAPESVHLCEFPKADKSIIDKDLENNMELLLEVVALGRACRSAANIKNRQPLLKMYVSSQKQLPEMFVELICDEINVKEVEFIQGAGEFTSYSLKPQMRTIGPKYGKLLGLIGQHLSSVDGTTVVNTLKNEGIYQFELDGVQIQLKEEDLLISSTNKPGFTAQSDNNIVVVLDVHLTQELIYEGYIRELVSKIQTMRKESDFNVTDHIRIEITTGKELTEVIAGAKTEIIKDVLGEELKMIPQPKENAKEWDINGLECFIRLEKA
jgi:isoleucyl-tRNA synthetase